MVKPEIVLAQVGELYEGLEEYKRLLVSGQFQKAEPLRQSLLVLWGEIEQDVNQLGVPRAWSMAGRVMPTFESALEIPDRQYVDFVCISIDKARASLEMAQGKLQRMIKQTAATNTPHRGSGQAKNVFIVHGHDGELRETVARFVEKLGLKAIVLVEQPNKGRTIIEKLERHDAEYAVVLLTPDDVGYPQGAPEQARQRARQNVILELGYFLGMLGRQNVCALHTGELELPSDIHGVVYVPVDQGWKLKLAQELRAAGLEVDLNKAME